MSLRFLTSSRESFPRVALWMNFSSASGVSRSYLVRGVERWVVLRAVGLDLLGLAGAGVRIGPCVEDTLCAAGTGASLILPMTAEAHLCRCPGCNAA